VHFYQDDVSRPQPISGDADGLRCRMGDERDRAHVRVRADSGNAEGIVITAEFTEYGSSMVVIRRVGA
jgi:hypothetical protein